MLLNMPVTPSGQRWLSNFDFSKKSFLSYLISVEQVSVTSTGSPRVLETLELNDQIDANP